MNEDIKKQLDQFGDLIDAKIEKAAGQIAENVRGEIDPALKNEIDALTNKWVETHDRLDSMEMASQKSVSNKPLTFAGGLIKSISEGAIESFKNGNTNAARFEMKGANDMSIAADFTGVVADETIVPQFKFDPTRATHIRQLLPIGSTDAQVIRFPKESGYDETSVGATAEGAALAQTDFDITATSVNVNRIGTFLRVTEEMLNDTPQLSSYISARVPEKILSIEDTQLLNGSGSGANQSGLFTDGTAFNATTSGFVDAIENSNEYDVLVAALNQLALSNYQADTILLNPTDLHKIALLKSTQNEYLRQQIYSGLVPQIMGVNITANTAVTAGKFLVGNLRQASQLWVRENLSVEFSRDDNVNFTKNLVTIRVQERIALTNYLPNAIVQGTFSNAILDTEKP